MSSKDWNRHHSSYLCPLWRFLRTIRWRFSVLRPAKREARLSLPWWVVLPCRRSSKLDEKMRDKSVYRAANGRAQAAVLQPSPGLALRLRRRFSRRFATGRAKSCPRPYLRPPPLHGHPLHWYPFQWYGYHSYGMHSQWNGLVCMQCIAYQWIAIDCLARRATGWGKRPTSPGALSLQFR